MILFVEQVRTFHDDKLRIADFGDVLVAYWDPPQPNPRSGYLTADNIIQYVDGFKIDFSVWPTEALKALTAATELPRELDAGYRVLLDKDGLTNLLKPPTFKGYVPTPPDLDTFLTLVNDFFVGVPCVAKCLIRDELLPAKWCLDYDMRYEFLMPIMMWKTECDHNWPAPIGVNGKGLKRWLEPDFWRELEATYAAASIDENWTALFRMIALFRQVGRDVASRLGVEFPEAFQHRVTTHAIDMQEHVSIPS